MYETKLYHYSKKNKPITETERYRYDNNFEIEIISSHLEDNSLDKILLDFNKNRYRRLGTRGVILGDYFVFKPSYSVVRSLGDNVYPRPFSTLKEKNPPRKELEITCILYNFSKNIDGLDGLRSPCWIEDSNKQPVIIEVVPKPIGMLRTKLCNNTTVEYYIEEKINYDDIIRKTDIEFLLNISLKRYPITTRVGNIMDIAMNILGLHNEDPQFIRVRKRDKMVDILTDFEFARVEKTTKYISSKHEYFLPELIKMKLEDSANIDYYNRFLRNKSNDKLLLADIVNGMLRNHPINLLDKLYHTLLHYLGRDTYNSTKLAEELYEYKLVFAH